jgi:hypothetical protein
MKTSDSLLHLAPALLAAQRLIGSTVKDKVGKILTKSGGSYEYNSSDLSSVLDAIKGPLNDNGIILLQGASADASGVIVNTRLLHESGEWLEESLYMPVSVNTPQAFGSAITYCRRYGAQSLTGLKAMDDDGAEASKEPAPRPITGKQVAVDALSEMTPEEQDFLRSHADKINAMPIAETADYVKAQNFDNDEKLALWSLLPPKVRSAIKTGAQRNLGEQA